MTPPDAKPMLKPTADDPGPDYSWAVDETMLRRLDHLDAVLRWIDEGYPKWMAIYLADVHWGSPGASKGASAETRSKARQVVATVLKLGPDELVRMAWGRERAPKSNKIR